VKQKSRQKSDFDITPRKFLDPLEAGGSYAVGNLCDMQPENNSTSVEDLIGSLSRSSQREDHLSLASSGCEKEEDVVDKEIVDILALFLHAENHSGIVRKSILITEGSLIDLRKRVEQLWELEHLGLKELIPRYSNLIKNRPLENWTESERRSNDRGSGDRLYGRPIARLIPIVQD
jgi:hypothetical protein